MENRVYKLDLLRAFAIMTVFMSHTVLSYGAPSSFAWLQFGGSGVDLFFVLSGWLIGSQLFKELDTYGDVDIKRFWVRRWMRTLPAYYAVLLFTITQLTLTKDNFTFPWHYFVFIQNYSGSLDFFTVSWSLCVEEQFYLAIAPILLFLSRFSAHQRTVILCLFLLMPTLFRVIDTTGVLHETHLRWDCCVMGILLANIKYSYQSLWQRLVSNAANLMVIAGILYLLFYVNRLLPEVTLSDPSKLILAFVFGIWVVWANTETQSKLIGHNAIMYISTRSYAIYLLHPDALAVCRKLFSDMPFIVYFAVALAISCIASEVLYRMVEQPIMNARSKFRWSCSRSRVEAFDVKREKHA